MTGNVFLFIFFFGGFIVTFLCLLSATFARSARSDKVVRAFFFVGAVCGLVYEGGCFAAASSFGNATGGGVSGDTTNAILAIGILVAVIWGFIILSLQPRE
jgi:hypothetical protein